MKNLYVIAASQDYEQANHKMLWKRLSQIHNTDVVVANIPADYAVTIFKRKFDRIKEARNGPVTISESLKVVRPFLVVRPEIESTILKKKQAKQFWKSINTAYSLEEYDEVRLIFYNAFWAKILYNTIPNLKMAYYLFDEVRNNGNDNSVNIKRYEEDIEGCQRASFIFAMSKDIAQARTEFKEKIFLLGNGAEVLVNNEVKRIEKSVAFIGNFRNWIDFDLLRGIIANNKEYSFFFIGPIEENMKDQFIFLQRNYNNVFYGGCKAKENIGEMYSMFESVIIPYKQTSFIHATRPIKIVESVMSGTPVVTVPVSGYEQNEFIHFATDVEQFSLAIKECSKNRINKRDIAYKKFVRDNSWVSKATEIDRIFNGEKNDVVYS